MGTLDSNIEVKHKHDKNLIVRHAALMISVANNLIILGLVAEIVFGYSSPLQSLGIYVSGETKFP